MLGSGEGHSWTMVEVVNPETRPGAGLNMHRPRPVTAIELERTIAKISQCPKKAPTRLLNMIVMELGL